MDVGSRIHVLDMRLMLSHYWPPPLQGCNAMQSISTVFELRLFIGMIVSTNKTKFRVFSPSMVDPNRWSSGATALQWVQQYKVKEGVRQTGSESFLYGQTQRLGNAHMLCVIAYAMSRRGSCLAGKMTHAHGHKMMLHVAGY